MTLSTALQDALEQARSGREAAEQDLLEELRIPSVSTLPQHHGDVLRNAEWLAARFEAAGCEAALHEVAPGGNPVLQADWGGAGAQAPTLTIYGHYDVQPADPLEEWESPPFEPRLHDGHVYARGSSDNKGNHMAALWAVRHAVATGGPPVNLRFLLEGEEEITGQSLARYLRANAERLRSEYTLVFDGGFAPDGRPSLVTGLRGILYVEMQAEGPGVDLHSGGYGGVAPNPLNTLAQVLAQLKGGDGRVTIPGFYDAVRAPEPAETAEWPRTAEYTETLRRLMQARALEGEDGVAPVDRQWARPTLDVNGMIGGFTGAGMKTVIPARATAKVSMRLVPDQDPGQIFTSLRDYVQELTTPGVAIRVLELSRAAPVLLGFNHHGALALRQAYAAAFGQPAAGVRAGGSVPVTLDFKEAVGGEIMCSGLAQPGAGAHSPNEHLSLDHFHRGTEMLLHLMWSLG